MICPTLQRLRELERDAWYGHAPKGTWGVISLAIGKLVHIPEGQDYTPGFLLDLDEEDTWITSNAS